MANKASFLSTINGFITAIVSVAKVRSAFSSTADQLYPGVVSDTHTAQTYTTKAGTNIEYSITIHKSGNTCHIKGSVHNTQTLQIFPQSIFAWKPNEYEAKATVNGSQFRAIYGNSSTINLKISDAGLELTSPFPALGTYEFDFKMYIAKD